MDITGLGEYDDAFYQSQNDSSTWEGREVEVWDLENSKLPIFCANTPIAMMKLGYTQKEKDGKERTIEITIDTRETSKQPTPPPSPPPASQPNTPKKPKDNEGHC